MDIITSNANTSANKIGLLEENENVRSVSDYGNLYYDWAKMQELMSIGFDVTRLHGYSMPVPIPGVQGMVDLVPVALDYGTGRHLPDTPEWKRMGGLIRHIVRRVTFFSRGRIMNLL